MKTLLIYGRGLLRVATLVIASLLVWNPAAIAAGQYFIQFDGITGDSTDEDHKGWSNLESFFWNVSFSSPVGSGSGSPSFSDLSWSQDIDKSVTGLFTDITNGRHIKDVVVDFTKNTGGTSFRYFEMTFDDVLLKRLALSGHGGAIPTLDGSLSYDKVRLDFWTQDPKGGIKDHLTAAYDLKNGIGSASAVASLFALGLQGPRIAAVPEPETYAMLALGIGLLGIVSYRQRKWARIPVRIAVFKTKSPTS